MPITETTTYESRLFEHTFTVSVGSASTTTQISDVFQQFKGKSTILVIATGLDASCKLTFTNGNTSAIANHGTMVDADNLDIIITVSNGSAPFTVNIQSFFVGFILDVLTATTGTITIQAAL